MSAPATWGAPSWSRRLAGDVFIDLASPIHLGTIALGASGEAHLSFLPSLMVRA